MIKRVVVIFIIICLLLMVIGLYYFISQNNGSIDNINTTEKDAMVKLALSNNNFKWYLDDNLSYNVTAVNSAQGYVLFDVGNNTTYWESVMVGIDLATNTTDYVYRTDLHPKNPDEDAKMIKIALKDGRVKGYINNNRYDVGDVNITENRIIFDIGPMTNNPGAVIVGVDHIKNEVTGVGYYPRTPLPPGV